MDRYSIFPVTKSKKLIWCSLILKYNKINEIQTWFQESPYVVKNFYNLHHVRVYKFAVKFISK